MQSRIGIVVLLWIALPLMYAADPRESEIKYLNYAAELSQQHKYREAVSECDKLLARNPNLVEAHYLRGVANRYLSRNDEALRDFTLTLHLKPDHNAALEARASLYRASVKLSEALRDYDSLVRLNPADVRFLTLRASLHSELQHPELALKDFDEALRLAPANAAVLRGRKRVAEYMARNNPGTKAPAVGPEGRNIPEIATSVSTTEIAVPENLTELASEPLVSAPVAQKRTVPILVTPEVKTPAALREKWADALAVGVELEKRHELDKAIAAYSESTRLSEVNPEAYLHLGLIYTEQNHLLMALHAFTLAIRYRAGYSDALKGRAVVKKILGDQLGANSDLAGLSLSARQ